MSRTLETVVNETAANPQWAVLWLHGLGADGHDFAAINAAIPNGARPPVFMAHGAQDPVIPQMIAADTAQRLTAAGFPLEWHSYSMAHQVCAEELQALGDWLDARFATA